MIHICYYFIIEGFWVKPCNYKESPEQQQAACNEVLAFLLRALNHHIFSKTRFCDYPIRESELEDASLEGHIS